MNGISAAIYASFFLAISQLALKKSYRDIEPSVSFLFDALFGILIWIPAAIVLGMNFHSLSTVLIYAIISAILSEAFVFYALSKGQLSITSILIASYPIYTILFSYFINGERLTTTQAVLVAITILGTLLSYLPSKLSLDELKRSKVFLWPLLAALCIGLSDSLSKHVIDAIPGYSFLFTLALVQVPIALIYLRLEKQKVRDVYAAVKNDLSSFKFALIGSLFNILGTGLLWVSFSGTLASIASPITATSGAFVVLLAVLFFDEKLNLKNVIGLILLFIGIMGLSI